MRWVVIFIYIAGNSVKAVIDDNAIANLSDVVCSNCNSSVHY